MDDSALIKILVVGDCGVGKTSIVNQFCYNNFTPNTPPTIGCDFTTKTMNKHKGKFLKLQLWDIAGGEKFKVFSKMYVRGSLGCLVVCEYPVPKSLDSTLEWKQRVEEQLELSSFDAPNTQKTSAPKIPIVLVQNKIDLMLEDPLEQQREEEKLKKFGAEQKFDKTFQTSAKFNINLKQAFTYITEEIIRRGLIKDFSLNYDIKRIFLKKGEGSITDSDNCRC